MSYIAFELTKDSRSKLANMFPPKYPDFIGHHVTYKFGVEPNTPLPKNVRSMKVVGYLSNGIGLEALIVEINGSKARPDGRVYHITWSLDRSAGFKPVDSNTMIMYGMDNIVWLESPIDFVAKAGMFK